MRLTRFSALIAALLAACGSGRSEPPRVVERIGGLEVLATQQRQAAGDSGRYTHYSRWSLRWNGAPVELTTAAGLFGDRRVSAGIFHAVFVLEGAGSVPDLLLLAGDPNNTGAFHRISQREGRLDVELLCIVSAGENQVAVPAAEGSESLRLQGPRLERLQARSLLLGEHCVYDVERARVTVVPPVPDALSLPEWGPILLQPGRNAVVRLLLDSGAPVLAAIEPLTLPEDMVAGAVDAQQWLTAQGASAGWQLHPVERRRMRYASAEEIDAAWIHHHFRWGDSASMLLLPRADAERLPYRGVLSPYQAEYRLEGLKPDQREQLVALLVERMGGSRVVDRDETSSVQVRMGEQTLEVHDAGFYISPASRYWPGKPEDPAVQRAAMAEIARRFDAELASGTLDGIFAGEDGP